MLFQLARYDDALPLYDETIRTARQRGEGRIELDATVEVADLHTERGELARAASLLDGIDHARFDKTIFNPLRRAHDDYSRGLLALARGQAVSARDLFVTSLAKFAQAKARFGLNVFALIGLARAELALGHRAQATEAALGAVALAQTFVPKEARSYLIGHSQATLGEIELADGDRGSARVTLTTALDHLQATLGAEHPATKKTQRLLASLPVGS